MDAFASGLAREWPDHGRSIEHALSKLAWVALAVGRRDDGMPCDECATEFIDRVWFRFDERQSGWTEQAEGPLRSPAGMLNVMATEVADRSRRGELPGDLVHWWATNGPDGYDWWTHDEKWAAIPHVHQLPAGHPDRSSRGGRGMNRDDDRCHHCHTGPKVPAPPLFTPEQEREMRRRKLRVLDGDGEASAQPQLRLRFAVIDRGAVRARPRRGRETGHQ